jgi:Rrf2 family protein
VLHLSQKCHYAIQAALELARRGVGQSLTIAEIAKAQHIPMGFLAVILTDLRKGGIVRSQRGAHGGYCLAKHPRRLSVADIISCIDGLDDRLSGFRAAGVRRDYIWGDRVLAELFERASASVHAIFAATDYADLIDRETANARTPTANYSI